MKSKKIYIVLIVIMIIFFLIMFFVFGLDELKKEGIDTTIIVDNDTVWTYSGKTWNNISSFNKCNWKKYDVYINNEKIGKYYLWYNDKWYVFDNNKNAVMIDGDLLGIKSNYNIYVHSFEKEKIDNYSYVYKVLEDNKLPIDSEYTVNYKVVFDYDGDGEVEEFYVITNVFPTGFNPKKIFSIVFMVKENIIYPIYTNVSNNKGLNGCRPYINSFIDIDDDNKYEFILSCSEYSVSGTNRMLYDFEDNKFKILISNN